ncbi:hypothetical protein Desdi_1517 [Desulfitobacterium dichloroeliminans LMG P-21439]|uniref:Iron-sulfur cluster assembly accessory protein n=1 Tax=Desulfitobacterium dichloroeliminans (strain LMG P-21439 / DCA1) TaxID=871963 RepID=L0F7N4_DESDL|nr:hypothetical protein Desdi_1517 [Desulfitobacterium dichloroeliminans LMG P-21439]
MMIKVTERAAEMLESLMTGQDDLGMKYLRISMGGYG